MLALVTLALAQAAAPDLCVGDRLDGPRGERCDPGGVCAGSLDASVVHDALGTVTLAAPVIRGTLDKALIETLLKGNLARHRYCSLHEMVKNPTVSGKREEDLVIAGDGTASSAVTRSSTLENVSIEACVSAQSLKMLFPAPTGGATVRVTYPITFTPR